MFIGLNETTAAASARSDITVIAGTENIQARFLRNPRYKDELINILRYTRAHARKTNLKEGKHPEA